MFIQEKLNKDDFGTTEQLLINEIRQYKSSGFRKKFQNRSDGRNTENCPGKSLSNKIITIEDKIEIKPCSCIVSQLLDKVGYLITYLLELCYY